MHKSMTPATILALTLIAAGCASSPGPGPGSGKQLSASAQLAPTQGSRAAGSVSFVQQDDALLVTAGVSGLTPGLHGFHIHEKGDCSAPDASSAGGHYNPTATKHGHPQAGEHHAGDLPMLQADASGNATLSVSLRGVSLDDTGHNIVGRSLVVHAGADDYTSQPAGNSGPRVACGVIVR